MIRITTNNGGAGNKHNGRQNDRNNTANYTQDEKSVGNILPRRLGEIFEHHVDDASEPMPSSRQKLILILMLILTMTLQKR